MHVNYDHLKYHNLNVSSTDSELQVLSIKVGSIKKLMIINCYRPLSGSVPRFFDELHHVLDSIDKLGEHELYMLGDFNIPYNLPSPALSKIKKFENKYNLNQVVNSPTRCTASTNNILDLIFTDSPYVSHAGPIETSLSDHEPVIVVRKKQLNKTPQVSFTCHTFGNYIKEDYQRDVADYDWTHFYSSTTTTDDKWTEIEKVITAAADKHCPYIEYRGKKHAPPWLNQEILETLKTRDELYKRAKTSKLELDWGIARKARNNCIKIVNAAKNNYILNLLHTEEKDSKKFWKVIQQVLPNSNQSRQQIHLTDQNTGLSIPTDKVPDYLNDHFCQIGASLSNSFPNLPKFEATVSEFAASFKLERATLSDVTKLVKGIDICKSSAIDGLTSRVL